MANKMSNFTIDSDVEFINPGSDNREICFEVWWQKLQISKSIAAWMIDASLPKGIAKQIYFDAWDSFNKLNSNQKE